jgi:hypothetical protein
LEAEKIKRHQKKKSFKEEFCQNAPYDYYYFKRSTVAETAHDIHNPVIFFRIWKTHFLHQLRRRQYGLFSIVVYLAFACKWMKNP